MHLLVIALGGAMGAVARYLLGGAVQRWASAAFPYGTLAVNVTGCLIFGLIIGGAESRFDISQTARAFLLVGLLGGYTTFSSFGYESIELWQEGRLVQAAAYIGGQVVISLIATAAGLAVGRAL